ncbi:MAG: sulfate transporter CysZ [Desulfobacterales bacterium]|nr:sulfate transporter CysZ [Desulfobacterales bacterium]
MNVFIGPKHLILGFRLIFKPGLRRFVMIPLFINIIIFTLLIWFSIGHYGNLLEWILPKGESWWLEILRPILWVLFAAAEVLFLFFSFTVAANLIGSPFNGLLSEKVEAYLTGGKIQPSSAGLIQSLAEMVSSFFNELRKLFYFILIGSFVLIISFIPVLNIISPFFWLIFTAWMLAFEYLSYPMENHRLVLKQVREHLAQKRLYSISFGFSVLGATLIPLINFFVMPAAVAGATSFWVEQWATAKRK